MATDLREAIAGILSNLRRQALDHPSPPQRADARHRPWRGNVRNSTTLLGSGHSGVTVLEGSADPRTRRAQTPELVLPFSGDPTPYVFCWTLSSFPSSTSVVMCQGSIQWPFGSITPGTSTRRRLIFQVRQRGCRAARVLVCRFPVGLVRVDLLFLFSRQLAGFAAGPLPTCSRQVNLFACPTK